MTKEIYSGTRLSKTGVGLFFTEKKEYSALKMWLKLCYSEGISIAVNNVVDLFGRMDVTEFKFTLHCLEHHINELLRTLEVLAITKNVIKIRRKFYS